LASRLPSLSLSTVTAPSQPYPLPLHDALPISTAAKLQISVCGRFGSSSNHHFAIIEISRIGLHISNMVLADLCSADKCLAAHWRSEEHTSELQSRFDLVCRLLLEKKNETTASA